jgi:hypothetical protein
MTRHPAAAMTLAKITDAAAVDIDVQLAQLAPEINREHDAVRAALSNGHEHARTTGQLLLEARAQCAHGTWLSWIHANFDGSERTAQAYMRVVREWDNLSLKEDPQRVADLPHREALRALSTPHIDEAPIPWEALAEQVSDQDDGTSARLALDAAAARLRQLDDASATSEVLGELTRIIAFAGQQQNPAAARRLHAEREAGRAGIELANWLNAMAPGGSPVTAVLAMTHVDEIIWAAKRRIVELECDFARYLS